MRRTRTLIWTLTAVETPIGVATGYLMALGNMGFLLGMAALMFMDHFASKVWLDEIKENGESREVKNHG